MRLISRNCQAGFAPLILLLIVGVVVALGAGGYFLFSKGKLPILNQLQKDNPQSADKNDNTPKPDLAHAVVKKIEAKKGGSLKLITLDKIVVSLEVPAGALKNDQEIKLVPLFTSVKDKNPTMGVVITPAELTFQKPVTLSFDYAETAYRSDGPKDWESEKARTGGKSQVLIFDKDKNTLTPTLVARAVETNTYLPSRILAAGYYLATLDGGDKQKFAINALDIEKLSSLSTMESSTALLTSGGSLNEAQKNKARSAVDKILGKKAPPVMEMYAALALQKKISSASTGFLVKPAYAATLSKEFFIQSCKAAGLSTLEYQTLYHMSLLAGFETESKACLDAAKKRAEEVSADVLKTKDVEPATALSQAQKVKALNLTSNNLDTKLKEKAKSDTKAGAQKILKDAHPNTAELARSIQKMDSVGLEGDALRQQLANEFKESTNVKTETKANATPTSNLAQVNTASSGGSQNDTPGATPFPLPNGLTDSALGYQAAMDAALIGFTTASLTVGLNSPDLSGVETMVDEVEKDTGSLDTNPVAFCMFMGIDGLPQMCNNFTPVVNNTIHEYDTQENRIEAATGPVGDMTEIYQTDFVDNYTDLGDVQDYYIDDYGSSDSYENYEDFTNYYSDYNYDDYFDWNAYYTSDEYFNPTGEDFSTAGDDYYGQENDQSSYSEEDYPSSTDAPVFDEGVGVYTPI